MFRGMSLFTSLAAPLAALLVIWTTGTAVAETVQYRESDFDFVALRSYAAAEASMTRWLKTELDQNGDGSTMPRDVKRTWTALVREAADNGNEDVDTLRHQLMDDALEGTTMRGWDGTYKGKPIGRSRAQARGSDPSSSEASVHGPDTSLPTMDLQNSQQQQQLALQTMSNVSKMLHDTAMAVIRKIGG